MTIREIPVILGKEIDRLAADLKPSGEEVFSVDINDPIVRDYEDQRSAKDLEVLGDSRIILHPPGLRRLGHEYEGEVINRLEIERPPKYSSLRYIFTRRIRYKSTT